MKNLRVLLVFSLLLSTLSQASTEFGTSGACDFSVEIAGTGDHEQVTAAALFPEDPRDLGSDKVRQLEEAALQAMRNSLPKNAAEESQSVRDWFSGVQSDQRDGRSLSVMEHSALTFILRSGIFDNEPDPTLLTEMRSSLRQSWADLTGTKVGEDQLTERLPRWVLRKASRDEILFHQAIFHEGPLGFLGSMKVLAQDYIPQPQDLVCFLMLGAALFSRTGSHILEGILEGYAINTFIEYFVHKYIGHASEKTLKMWDRVGWLGKRIRVINFSHKLHHGIYGENYVIPFGSHDPDGPEADERGAAKKARIDDLVNKKGEKVARGIFKSDYGRRLETPLEDMLMVMPFSMALIAFNFVIGHQFGVNFGIPFDVALTGSSVLFIPASFYMHQYLHQSREEGSQRASARMKWFLKTRYVGFINQAHFSHHHEGGVYNENLAVGADLFLGYQPVTVEQLLELRRVGALY